MKEQRAEQARKWNEHIQKVYAEEIKQQIVDTKIYRGLMQDSQLPEKRYEDTIISMKRMGTVEAAIIAEDIFSNKVALLNFASYKNPGGRFLDGSSAQEEAICHESTLYPVLKHFDSTYYAQNKGNLNGGLYTDAALYTKDVMLFKDEHFQCKADVITCAAPNLNNIIRYGTALQVYDAQAVFKQRIEFMLQVAVDQGVDTLILGAWGCGVFKNDPCVLGRFSRELICGKYKGYFQNVIFAIPDSKNSTLLLKGWGN